MFSILLACSPEHKDELIADLWEAATEGIVEEDGRLRAFFADSIDAARMLERFAEFGPDLRNEAPVDWEQVASDAWPPLLVGERFFLVAPWRDDPTPEGRLRLEITPGMACGTGRHPATQLCLEALERYVRPGDFALDVGTGSGILSAAAGLLGAAQVVSCDIDPDAIPIARQRLDSALFIGSADAVRDAVADIVVANINSAVIEQLAADLARVRKPQSTLILAGFPEWDLPEGFSARATLKRDEWVCWIC